MPAPPSGSDYFSFWFNSLFGHFAEPQGFDAALSLIAISGRNSGIKGQTLVGACLFSPSRLP
jgi:hypothetical protein